MIHYWIPLKSFMSSHITIINSFQNKHKRTKPDASSDSWPSYYVAPKCNVDRYACLPTYLPHLNTMKALNLEAVQITSMYCNSHSMCYTFYIWLYLYYTSHFLTCCKTAFVHVIVMTKCFIVFIIFSAHVHLLYSYTDELVTHSYAENDRRVGQLFGTTMHSLMKGQ